MRTVDTTELKRMLDQTEDLVLINALDPASFEREHIPGSVNVSNQDPNLVRHVEGLAGRKDRRIVVYCANPQCHASHEAIQKLESAGFTNVVHYPGGIDGWRAEGHAMEHGVSSATA